MKIRFAEAKFEEFLSLLYISIITNPEAGSGEACFNLLYLVFPTFTKIVSRK